MMQKNRIRFNWQWIGLFWIAVSLSSCQGTKGLQEGERLYTGAKIKLEAPHLTKKERNELKDGIEANVTPKPNMTFLGMRPKLAIYNMIGETKKQKGIKHWLKTKLGEPPVLLKDVNKNFNVDIIENYAQNKGYFNAQASFDVQEKKKTASIEYDINPDFRYFIDSVNFPADTTSSLILKEIAKTKNKSILQPGEPFDLEVIKNERQRIDAHLKQRGFYYFSPDNLIVLADSTISKEHKVALDLKLKEDTPELATEAFTIDQTVVYANYDLNQAEKNKFTIPAKLEALKPLKDIFIIDPENTFKPEIFEQVLVFHKGELYNRKDHNTTLNRLINLGVFKFVKNQFVVTDSLKHTFDAYYLLTPKKFKSLRLETLGKTNSDNFVGGELNLNWSHRNLFRGAEHFKFSVFASTDYQIGGPENANNLLRYGASASLEVPRLWIPLLDLNTSGNFLPRTHMEVSYEFQKRTQLYTLGNFNTNFGYIWKENIRKEHHLKVMDVSYVHASNVTDTYKQKIANNPHLQRVVENQLIFGPTYTYTYTNTMLPQANTIYFQGQADISAIATGLIMGADAKAGKQKELFNVPYSQYAKIDNDFRYYHHFTQKSMLATRLIAGMAYPFGNSIDIPFSKQFFVGGSNSLRGFRARTLGPGTYSPNENQQSILYDQTGDIKLETSLEYRFNIYRFLNGAIFTDAGNVWLVNENKDRPGGKFTSDFYKEIAVDAGIGLRFDFSIFVLRLDLATPLRIPSLPEGDRWTFKDIDLGNKEWRKNNLILNIGIGYPF